MSLSHRHTSSGHTIHSEDNVDSAATTLLASNSSSKAQSFEEPKEYAERGWKRLNAREQDDNDRSETPDHGILEDDEEDEDEDAAEGDGLLAGDNVALGAVGDTEETARNVDGEQPLLLLPKQPEKPQPVSWSSLPKKSQLAILTLARLSEPLTQTSLQAYQFYQLKSFHAPGVAPPSDATVARQAGMLAAAFTGAQFLVAMMWGRLADSERFGRKRVILIGLLGTAIGTLGFGFSSSFAMAVFWRCVGGILNGNMGVMRTMISEIVREKKFQSRAFLLLPMTFVYPWPSVVLLVRDRRR